MLATDRQQRPQDFLAANVSEDTEPCPFCRGREAETTPTIVCFSDDSADLVASPVTCPNWQVRVVENLYPCFVPSRESNDSATEIGQHEVIIEAPNHLHRLTQLSGKQTEIVLRAYRHRMQVAAAKGAAYGLIFKNSGQQAGMSRQHIHSQFVGLPETPPAIRSRLARAARFYRRHEKCLHCQLISDSLNHDQERLVANTDDFVAYCPFASRTPYEIRIAPRSHHARFEECSDTQINQLSTLLRDLLKSLDACLPGCAYNYIIHTLPFDTCRIDHYHWHIEIIPRVSFLAGLEWGAGILVNTVSPTTAAEHLRTGAKL